MTLQAFYDEILSTERLTSFCLEPNEPKASVIERYLWNIALCESLYPSLHMLEVVLRNRVHSSLSLPFGEGWLLNKGNSACLRLEEQHDVQKVIDRIKKEGKQVTPDRVVAGLNLGFWVFLLSRNYEFVFWRKNLHAVFPNFSRKDMDRKKIHTALRGIWALRNRVSHHEPIWNQKHLQTNYSQISYLLKGLSEDAYALLQRVDRFPLVLKQKPLTS